MNAIAPLIFPAFLAGIFTFLAPCTLPLLPGFLGFLSGTGDERSRRRMFMNSVSYALGFSTVFILLGSILGAGGSVLAEHRAQLARIGGVFLIFFGLVMLGVFKLPILRGVQLIRIPGGKHLVPGRVGSSFILGATFALGWTPCAGPILGSILTLAAASATFASGAFLLLVFSLGLAVPFMLFAFFAASATRYVARFSGVLNWISFLGGALLVFLGLLLVAGEFYVWLDAFNRFLVLPDWFANFL